MSLSIEQNAFKNNVKPYAIIGIHDYIMSVMNICVCLDKTYTHWEAGLEQIPSTSACCMMRLNSFGSKGR